MKKHIMIFLLSLYLIYSPFTFNVVHAMERQTMSEGEKEEKIEDSKTPTGMLGTNEEASKSQVLYTLISTTTAGLIAYGLIKIYFITTKK